MHWLKRYAHHSYTDYNKCFLEYPQFNLGGSTCAATPTASIERVDVRQRDVRAHVLPLSPRAKNQLIQDV